MSATLDRREFVGRVLTAGSILAAPRIVAAVAQGSGDPIARTRFGRVRGARKDGVIVFKGIPFAGPPT
jgi:para-nitrobenzyl esterase